jgi:hypothetical protein
MTPLSSRIIIPDDMVSKIWLEKCWRDPRLRPCWAHQKKGDIIYHLFSVYQYYSNLSKPRYQFYSFAILLPIHVIIL